MQTYTLSQILAALLREAELYEGYATREAKYHDERGCAELSDIYRDRAAAFRDFARQAQEKLAAHQMTLEQSHG